MRQINIIQFMRNNTNKESRINVPQEIKYSSNSMIGELQTNILNTHLLSS